MILYIHKEQQTKQKRKEVSQVWEEKKKRQEQEKYGEATGTRNSRKEKNF